MDTTLLQGLALLETQDGKKSIKGPNGEDSHNLFNIKDFSGQGFRAHDKAEGSRDAYRVYGSREESIQDLLGLLERKYPKARAALEAGDAQAFAVGLKEGGYATDPNYVAKLTSTIKRARGTDRVQQSVLAGEGAMGQLAELRKTGWGADIDEALKNGWKPEEIVKRIAGAEVDEAQAAKKRQDDKGAIGRFAEGVSNTASDMLLAARQIAASPDQEQGFREEAQRRRGDIDRQANAATTAGTIGSVGLKAVPSVAAAFVPGGLPTMVAAQGAAGAATEALEPTVEDGERLGNVVRGGLTGAGTMGAVGVVGKGLSKTAAAALKRDPAVVAERQALADAARAEGLPVNAATLTERGKQFAEALPDNASVKAMQSQADDVIASKIGEGLGLQGYKGAIDSNLLNTARDGIKQALDDATNVTIKLPQSLKGDLDALVNGANNPLTKGIAGDTTVRQAAANVIEAIDDGTVLAGRQLQDLASELKAVASNLSASAAERKTAGEMVGKLNKALTDAMTPDQAVKFGAANKQYANLKAVEKMVAASGDTGVVTPRQVLNAVKSGRFKNAFLHGEAPFQELGVTAAKLLGPANGKGLGSILGRTVGTGDSVLGAASILEPTTGVPLLVGKKLAEIVGGKMATSENPLIVRALTGIDGGVKGIDPAVRKYIAKALGAGLSTASR